VDVFVHDRETGQTTRVSVASDGTESHDYSSYPAISANGRYVVFESEAGNLVSGDTNEGYDIFVHDRETGQTTRVSVAPDGTQANQESFSPAISADGRYVVFSSRASNLASGDTNGNSDIFVHDRKTGQNILVSVVSDGTQANGSSDHPTLSADGRYVAFESGATNLVEDDTNEEWDIFVHDRETGQTTRASVASDGTQGNRRSGGNIYHRTSVISADGRHVAFESEATNLVEGDTNDVTDVFVRDRGTLRP
jgi:Tol biopolymer transport system component